MLLYCYNKWRNIKMKEIVLNVQEDLLNNVAEVLDDIGLDVNSAIKMFFKRIDKEKSIGFLISASPCQKNEDKGNTHTYTQTTNDSNDVRMTKNLAIRLFRENGYTIGNNVTFASKNKMAYNYWANPDFSVLQSEWELILNDWQERTIYLFRVPANSITSNALVCRNDKKSAIDLQIAYGDISFTDNRSKVSFKPYLIDSLKY